MYPWKKSTRQFDCVVPVSGVPFISETRCIKTISIEKRDAASLIIVVTSKTLDAPYSDTFCCKDVTIVHGSPNQERCIMT